MRVVIAAVAAILAGLALATGVTVGVSTTSAPDREVNLDIVQEPNPWSGAVNYGSRSR